MRELSNLLKNTDYFGNYDWDSDSHQFIYCCEYSSTTYSGDSVVDIDVGLADPRRLCTLIKQQIYA